MKKNVELEKEAAFGSLGLAHALEIGGGLLKGLAATGPAGAIIGGGLGVLAQKTGAGIAVSLTKQELDRVFEDIIRRNPEFASRRQQIRLYFDTVVRHSPDVAKDIMTVEGLIKNMDTFGGASIETIKHLAEIQNKKEPKSERFRPFTFK